MPRHYVFGALYRMFLYHYEHPLPFISIPCFFYGIIAALFADKFLKQGTLGRILITIAIVVLTLLISSPFGGMLWHYYDMKAGYFPGNWMAVMVKEGVDWGFKFGWIVIGLSIPFNILAAIGCYFVTKKGSELFKPAQR